MSGDWIKFEKETLDKQEILEIAIRLQVTHERALLACLKWWCWCDSNLSAGVSCLTTTESVDLIVGLSGFGDALLIVGWLDNKSLTLKVPYFERHMGESAKRRAMDRNRKQKKRRTTTKTELNGNVADK